MPYVTVGPLQVAQPLFDFVATEAIPGTGLTAERFWQGFAALLRDFAPRNKLLLAERDRLQQQVDAWHDAQRGKPIDGNAEI